LLDRVGLEPTAQSLIEVSITFATFRRING